MLVLSYGLLVKYVVPNKVRQRTQKVTAVIKDLKVYDMFTPSIPDFSVAFTIFLS